MLTHAFNAMPGIHHRAPGPVLAAAGDRRVVLEVIADGVHLAPEVVTGLFAVAGRRLVLVTDAMSAAGLGVAGVDVTAAGTGGTTASGAVGTAMGMGPTEKAGSTPAGRWASAPAPAAGTCACGSDTNWFTADATFSESDGAAAFPANAAAAAMSIDAAFVGSAAAC